MQTLKTTLLFILVLPVSFLIIFVCNLIYRRRRKAQVRRCGLCSTALLSGESAICGPCAVQQDRLRGLPQQIMDPVREAWCGNPPLPPEDETRTKSGAEDADPFGVGRPGR
jgi:hypothetical protein